MLDLLQTILLVLLLAIGIYLAIRIDKLRQKISRLASAASSKGETVGEERGNWRQIDALTSVYRAIDGLPTLPQTGGWAVAPDFIRILQRHIAKHEPKVILECGSGTSTVAMAYAVSRYGGRIVALENHHGIAARLEEDLRSRGLDHIVTIVRCGLQELTYPGFDHTFLWYKFEPEDLPVGADMLVVDGPWGKLNAHARYPAGPELLPTISRQGHIFLDDTARSEEGNLPGFWRAIYPDLGIRKLDAEKGAVEMVFLDGKIDDYRDS